MGATQAHPSTRRDDRAVNSPVGRMLLRTTPSLPVEIVVNILRLVRGPREQLCDIVCNVWNALSQDVPPGRLEYLDNSLAAHTFNAAAALGMPVRNLNAPESSAAIPHILPISIYRAGTAENTAGGSTTQAILHWSAGFRAPPPEDDLWRHHLLSHWLGTVAALWRRGPVSSDDDELGGNSICLRLNPRDPAIPRFRIHPAIFGVAPPDPPFHAFPDGTLPLNTMALYTAILGILGALPQPQCTLDDYTLFLDDEAILVLRIRAAAAPALCAALSLPGP